TIKLSGDDSATVIVDEINARSSNREKILKSYTPNSITIGAKEFLAMTKNQDYGTREIVRDNDVVYIYHNIIDHEGKQETEDTVFRAAEECLNELKQIVRKLTSANATNVIITADHGFLYQFKSLQESDFSSNNASGEEIIYLDRRFVIGKNLENHQSFKKFSEKELGLDGELEILIPKSINRLRKKKSSSKFVHGGATLQEIVVPVVQINKKRKTDTLNVDASVISGQSSIISSGQISITFYQQESVTDKLLPRVLKVGIYSKDAVLISDTHTLTFDLKSDNPRERELKVRFLLSTNSDDYNNQEVFLKLEKISPAPETSHDKFYGDGVKYTLRKSIKSDFDF
ncbi:MAG: BREX-1 system phosphatase PglZ type A, partial [Epsilonproteobacteria bacterium]|nr:BREX-1 system phosphatase PglZ type A [Campylobacterota bacterium]